MTDDELLTFLVCRQEALARTTRELRKRELVWESLPGLHFLGDPSRPPRSSGKSNVSGPFRRFAKSLLPDYEVRGLTLAKTLAPDFAIRLIVGGANPGGGSKRFEARLRVDWTPAAHAELGPGDDFFSLFGGALMSWDYRSPQDLDRVLEAAFGLFAQSLPVLEQQCRTLLVPLPVSIPAECTRRGPITARRGLPEARAMAEQWAGGTSLPLCRIGHVPLCKGKPAATLSGENGPYSTWDYMFTWKQRQRAIWVSVPQTGPARHYICGVPRSAQDDPDLPDGWIDSDQALRAAAVNETPSQIIPILEVIRNTHLPVWRIHGFPTAITVNALTGEVQS